MYRRLGWVGLIWVGTLALVVASVAIGVGRVRPLLPVVQSESVAYRMAMAWDGMWYDRIAREGYTFDRVEMSSVVFFPAFPLAGRWLSDATGMARWVALLVTANLCWLGALAMMAAYVRDRLSTDATATQTGVAMFAVLAMACWPVSFFCRAAYTEPLLTLLLVTALYGMRRNWHPLAVASVIGLATATRSVGVALLLPFALHLWDRRPRSDSDRSTRASVRFVAVSAGWMVVACWGVLAFMAFQAWRFHDPLAFVQAQGAWHTRLLDHTATQRLLDIVTFEPVRSTFSHSSLIYWNLRPPHQIWFSLLAANPVFFVLAILLLLLGIARRWLNRYEALLGITLLAIPYLLQGPRMGMASMGRFVTVVFPIYLVIGHILARLPRWTSIPLLTLSLALLGVYACYFSTGYFLY